MRLGLIAALTALAGLAAVTPAPAGPDVQTKVVTYPIAGRTGAELLMQMDRKGPRHGFLTRAIAQTRYVVKWRFTWESDGQGCRLKQADAGLVVTYNYPHVTSPMPAALDRKWRTFMRGVRKHEETHGLLAQRMTAAAARAVSGLSVARDPRCRGARAEVKRRISAVYAEYEARQRAFDAREHADNGRVIRLVEALLR